MRKTFIVVSILFGAALALIACSGAGLTTPQANPLSGTQAGPLSTQPVTSTLSTPAGQLSGTPAVSPTMSAPGNVTTPTVAAPGGAVTPTVAMPGTGVTPTVAAPGTGITPTVVSTQALTGTQALPATGKIDPGLVSNLIQFGVFGTDGTKIGETSDLVIDITAGQITYLVVNANGKLVPVPWRLVMIVSSSTTTGGSSNGPNNDFVLNVTPTALSGAPSFAAGAFPDTQQMNWDSSLQSYWSQFQAGSPASGGTNPGSGAATPTPTP